MRKFNILKIFKQAFQRVLPAQDKRTVISHMAFVSSLVFCFTVDSKTSSLEGIRRFTIATFGVHISKGAFWERLSGKRLNNMLHEILEDLIKSIPSVAIMGAEILDKLGVSSILLMDSSSISLWDGAKGSHPGTRTTAGIKWHACFDLLSGKMQWYSKTSTKVHDRKCFPDIKWLKGKLIIFDLGYWDYALFDSINKVGGFFLSRVKSNATVTIMEIVKGINNQFIGDKLNSIALKKRRGKIVEFIGQMGSGKKKSSYRVIGFWNTTEKRYHWYVTNLTISSTVIYTLYRVRWQIELIFKGCKQSLNLDGKSTSNNENIIDSLILSSIIASFSIHLVLAESAKRFTHWERLAISFQRVAHVVCLLKHHFIYFLNSHESLRTLVAKINGLSREILEKNHKHRPTTLQMLAEELGAV